MADAITDAILGRRQGAQDYAIGSLEDDPEDAARALELSRATGIDPTVIRADVPTFEANHKASLAGELLRSNPHLTSYVDSDPFAAKVSNDDWGNLDTISQALGKIGPIGVMQKAVEGFKEKSGGPQLGAWMLQRPGDIAWAEDNPVLANAIAALGGYIEAPAKIISGGLGALHAGGTEALMQLGMEERTARSTMRDITAMAEYQLQQTPGKNVGVPKFGEAIKNKQVGPLENAIAQLDVAIQKSAPYIRAGKEPPIGLDPAIDKLVKEQSDRDLKNLAELTSEAQKSATRERSPELFERFIAQKNDTSIGIAADAVAELYGNNRPHAEDNLLGWAPDIERQMYLALASGGDIEIPLATWLARVEPEVAKQLHDFIRVRRSGITKAEGEVLSQSLSIDKPPVAPEEQATTSVRTAAKLDPLFEQAIAKEATAARDGEWVPIGKSVEGFVPEKFTEFEVAVSGLVEAELATIVPKKVNVQFASDLRKTGEQKTDVGGVYTQFNKQAPTLVLALANQLDIPGVGRHEAIHHLRAYGFFSDTEWATLAKAAEEEGWISKERAGRGSSIVDKYKGLAEDKERFLEEAIADEFRYWNRNPGAETLAAKVFEKLKAFLESVKSAWDALATKNPEVNEIFKMIESGEIGRREGTKPRHPQAFDKFSEKAQGELDVTRQEDKKLFATIAGWMNKAQQATYMELIAKRNAEDMAYQLRKAEKLERQRQTAEWKQAEAPIRAEVEADIAQRPDLGVLEFFRSGKLYGEETGTRPRVDPALLTEEQRKLFPEKYQRRDGMPPEDVAQLFGYTSFDDLAAKLAQLDKELGNKTTAQFIQRVVAAETERRMVQKFGDLEENILREAQEHVISDTQMDLLHEEVVALGMKVGSEMTFTKADFRKWVETKFNDARASEVSLETYLRDAGKAGREVEAALLKEDPTLAFQQKQRQLLAMLLAEQAKKFEKEQAQYARLAKRFSQRVVKGLDQGFTDWVQKLLLDAGEPGRRSAMELQEATLRSGFAGLREFVDSYRNDGWELTVEQGLQEGRTKAIDQMTVQEFREFKESLDSLAHVGREVNKIIIAGDAVDFDVFKGTVLDNIRSLPLRDKSKPSKFRFVFDSELAKLEEVFKDLDLRKELGPLFNAIIRPMADAKHTEFAMLEKLTKDLKEIKGDFGKKWQRTLKDDIPQDFLIDPHDKVPFDLSREHMINIMLNFGNRSNIDKFTKGYGGKDGAARLEGQLWRLFEQHASKEDWQYVQKIWNLWEGWRVESDKLYYDLAGVPPKWIEPTPITNQHGTFAGGYFPVIYDRMRSNINLIEAEAPSPTKKNMFGTNYFRATPGNSYTKTRTGYIDAIQFENPVDQTASRMQQVIHDISYRRAIMGAGKVLYDREIFKEIGRHYGLEYQGQIEPWLKKTANQFSMEEANLSGVNSWLRRSRSALIIHALGLNLKVILSPATALTNFADFNRYGLPLTEKRAINSEMILAKSRELPHTFRNMDRDFREQLDAAIHGNKWDQWQAKAMELSFWPTVKVDQYFREATFYNEYTKALEAGRAEGEAIALADSFVRERHGSGAVVDLPAIMRGNEALKMATIFYGFFNTMYNWQRQIPGQLRRGEYIEAAKTGWGALVVPAIFGAILFNERKEGENVFWTWAKAIPLQLASTIPLARDVANQFIEGHGSRTPWTSFIEAASAAYNDVRKTVQGKKVEKPIRHGANVIGLGAGLPLGQAGRTTQFLADIAQDKPAQRPRNIIEWMRGIIHGEARLKKEKK